MSEDTPVSAGEDRRKAIALPENAMQASGQIRAEADGQPVRLLHYAPSDRIALPANQNNRAVVTDQQKKKTAAASQGGKTTDRSIDAMAERPKPVAVDSWMTPYDAEAFHIRNAGLVLVAPFFRMVFEDLGYLEDGHAFATDEIKVRAVHFSQYVVTAKHHPAECDLILNKIICGMDVNAPMARFVDLTDRECEAAEDVLTSAIGHWRLLKRTSAAVFRQTFLQHDGILTGAGGNWLLRIERISADVLIDTLPWTISIIKHPWMQQPVMVEW